MPPRRRIVTDDDEETLTTCVFFERVIWDEHSDNKENGYLISQAWDRVAKKMSCKKHSIIKKWNEMLGKKGDIIDRLNELDSSHAGGPTSRSGVAMHYSDQLGFLQDSKTPKIKTSGNLDALVTKSANIVPAMKTAERADTCSKSLITSNTNGDNMTDYQFCASTLDILSELDDESKLDVRIEIMELLGAFADKIGFSDDEEITELGTFTPAK